LSGSEQWDDSGQAAGYARIAGPADGHAGVIARRTDPLRQTNSSTFKGHRSFAMSAATKSRLLLLIAMNLSICASAFGKHQAALATSAPTTKPMRTVFAVVLDFNGPEGGRLADSVRLRLRNVSSFDVLDRISTQEASGPVGTETSRKQVAKLMGQLASEIAVCGSVHRSGAKVSAKVHCLDARGTAPVWWSRTFTNDSPRWRAVISKGIVEAVTGSSLWVPPQYGHESEPAKFAKPLNVNGSFEAGWKGWDRPDGVSTFIEPGPAGRAKVLRIRNDLARDPWLAWRRKLMLGQADPHKPPEIPPDTSYACVAGLEGVHYNSEWIKATPGRRYWLVCDVMPAGGTPKVFVKGFRKTPYALDGLAETSLADMDITPEQFASMTADKRKRLIQADAAKRPMRYLRECYRWYLNMPGAKGKWSHHAAPFPPRGGLPANVEWLQIQVYAYWPPGEYLFDDILLYADPRQTDPLSEAKPRTPNFGKTSDLVDHPTSRPAH